MGEPRVLVTDGSLWALFKPAGMLVHATAGDESDLIHWAAGCQSGAEGLAPCHRLDKGTSGVVLCSTDPSERGAIGTHFAEGAVKKVYLALVSGRPGKKGTINRALKDGRRGRKVEARTRYRCIEELGGFALLEVAPETGRRHQIRRHLQGIGYPIVGDARYGPRRFRRVPGYPGRMWLHAASIKLPDGRLFEAPLPPELVDHLTLLRGP
jgi:23S rRNA-/tRNA-specific pseudouridylate synthase